MRTTLNLNEKLISQAMELSEIPNKTRVIELALSDFVRKLKRERVKWAEGKIRIDPDYEQLRAGEPDE